MRAAPLASTTLHRAAAPSGTQVVHKHVRRYGLVNVCVWHAHRTCSPSFRGSSTSCRLQRASIRRYLWCMVGSAARMTRHSTSCVPSTACGPCPSRPMTLATFSFSIQCGRTHRRRWALHAPSLAALSASPSDQTSLADSAKYVAGNAAYSRSIPLDIWSRRPAFASAHFMPVHPLIPISLLCAD